MNLPFNNRKMLVYVFFFLLVLSPAWSRVFISVNQDLSLGSPERLLSPQFMAVDHASDGRTVLRSQGGSYTLELGSWYVNTTKTYTSAFAIVNPESRSFRIRNISLAGSPRYVDIYLHKNMTRPSDPSIVGLPSESCEPDGDTILYYSDGETIERPGGWVLESGQGYDGEGNLIYSNATETASASREAGVWYYDRDGPRLAEQANFVWVEISVYPPSGAHYEHFTAPISIDIDAEFVPSQTAEIEYMSADYYGGEPVFYYERNNQIRFTVDSVASGSTVVIPAAAGLINTSPNTLRVSRIDVQGDVEGYLRIYLHGNHSKPSSSELVGDDMELDDSALLYYDGTSIDRSIDGWLLASGDGYTDLARPYYGTSGTWTSATRLGGYSSHERYVWFYDAEFDNLASSGDSNFVWIEISIVVPEDAQAISVDSTISIRLSSQ